VARKSKSLKWYGKAVKEDMRAAQIDGVNQTMGACVVHAKRNHTWNNRTAILEGGIDIADYAVPHSSGVKGTWGVRDVVYARIHELGGTIKPKTAKALRFRLDDGTFVVVQQVTMPARPYLRPAADAEYPKLAERIRRAYGRRAKPRS
jgi:phage gpG-like protein